MNMTVNQKEFDSIIQKFDFEDDSFRGDIWHRCRKLLCKGYIYEAYALLLATWNFARMRLVITKLDSKTLSDLINETELLYKNLNELFFIQVDFYNLKLSNNIKEIYAKFRNIKGIEQTGASKLMALRKPVLFVMWDTKIRKYYKINNKGTPEDYLNYLKILQKEFKHIKWDRIDKPFAKAIDEYNYYINHVKMH